MEWISTKDKLPKITNKYSYDDNYDDECHYVLVVLQYKDNTQTITVASYEQWDEDESPVWYDNSSEHWDLEDRVSYWMELPKKPK